MSFLEDLIRTIQEATDEANGRPPRPVVVSERPASAPASGDDERIRERLRRRAEDARHAQSEAEKAERLRVEHQHRVIAAATAAASAPAVSTAHAAQSQAASSALRLGRLLHQQQTAREAFLLSEVFGRPLSQHPRRFGRR